MHDVHARLNRSLHPSTTSNIPALWELLVFGHMQHCCCSPTSPDLRTPTQHTYTARTRLPSCTHLYAAGDRIASLKCLSSQASAALLQCFCMLYCQPCTARLHQCSQPPTTHTCTPQLTGQSRSNASAAICATSSALSAPVNLQLAKATYSSGQQACERRNTIPIKGSCIKGCSASRSETRWAPHHCVLLSCYSSIFYILFIYYYFIFIISLPFYFINISYSIF